MWIRLTIGYFLIMYRNALFFTILLCVGIYSVKGIGECERDIVERIITTNGCPTNILQKLYSKGPMFTFRIFAASAAKRIKCATGLMEEPPQGNTAVLKFMMTFKDPKIPPMHVNYTMVEGRCGLFFKYVAEDSYTAYELAGAYMDSNAFGYYGCTDQDPKADGNLYIVCLARQEDSEEVSRSVEACKQRLQWATGGSDIVTVPHCTNRYY